MGGRGVFVWLSCALAVAAGGGARAQTQIVCSKGLDIISVRAGEQCPPGYKSPPGGKKAAKKSSTPKTNSSSASPGKFAKVSPRRQSELDKKRGAVLFYELRSERRIEEQLEGLIADAGDESRRRRLEQRRDEHRRNVAAIRRELERLGYAVSE